MGDRLTDMDYRVADLALRYRHRRLFISFSAGRSSARMTKMLLDDLGLRGRRNVIVGVANTGEEDERALAFADRCDREWDLGLVWIEGVVDPRVGHGTRHRVVTFETAARKGEPFEAVIGKYGLPGPGYLHCNRETKLNPITSYLRSIGWEAGSYDTAIGYRADELDRQHPDARKLGYVYPLIRTETKKADVIAWWREQPFDLYHPEHLGNCRWCWKKSLRKHLTLARDHPEVFEFPARMEAEHALTNSTDGQARKLFRGRRTVADLRTLAGEPFEAFVDGNEAFDPDLDVGAGCGESCEIDEAEAA